MLANRNRVYNKRLSISSVSVLKDSLAHVGYMNLYITPYPNLPDHHDLVVFSIDNAGLAISSELDELEDGAAEVVIAAILQVEDNPTPAQRP